MSRPGGGRTGRRRRSEEDDVDVPGIGGGRTRTGGQGRPQRARAGRGRARRTRACSATRRPGWCRTSSTSASTARACSTPPPGSPTRRSRRTPTPRRPSTRSCAARASRRGIRLRHQRRRLHHPAHRPAGQRARLLPHRHPDDGGRRQGAWLRHPPGGDPHRRAAHPRRRRRRRPAPQGGDGLARRDPEQPRRPAAPRPGDDGHPEGRRVPAARHRRARTCSCGWARSSRSSVGSSAPASTAGCSTESP